MFPSATTTGPNKRSLREFMRSAVGSALEFATLGEASLVQPHTRPAPPAPAREHPHRRALSRHSHARRAGIVRPRAQVCTAPVASLRPRRRH